MKSKLLRCSFKNYINKTFSFRLGALGRKMRKTMLRVAVWLLLFPAITAFPTEGLGQNYLGYSKEYIIEAIKAERKDLTGPVPIKRDSLNYIIYTTRDARRAIVYYFQVMPVTLDNGKQMEEEICVKYYSKNKCLSYTRCPQMGEVMHALDSHFEQGGTYLQWIDYSKRNPQEWMLVRDNDYFEVHVMELYK